MTIVVPISWLIRRSRPKISAAVTLSSSPVGSSASRTSGSLASATAIATRCCSPPDSRSGRWSARSPSPTVSRSCEGAGVALGLAVEDHRQLDVLDGGQVRQQVAGRLLPDHPDRAAAVGRPLAPAELAEVVAGHARPSGRRHVQAAQDVEQRGLAAARGADDGDHLARADDEVEALQGDDLEVGHLVDADEALADDPPGIGRDGSASCGSSRRTAGRRSRAWSGWSFEPSADGTDRDRPALEEGPESDPEGGDGDDEEPDGEELVQARG